jgi:hypothetical protein
MIDRRSSEIIEDLITSLEAMIDALDEEWSRNHEGSWRIADDIRNRVLPQAKQRFKDHLDEYIDRRIETYLAKQGDSQ